MNKNILENIMDFWWEYYNWDYRDITKQKQYNIEFYNFLQKQLEKI